MRQILIFGLLVLVLSACERSQSKSRVIVQLPSLEVQKATSDFSLLDVDDTEQDGNWSPLAPTGFSGTARPFNCYIIMASGPEEAMRVNRCGRERSDGYLADAFYFGPVAGAHYAGKTLQFDVPSGVDREFRLVGFNAASESDCRELKDKDFDKAVLSRPYVLAKSAKTKLSGGDVVIDLALSYDTENWFDECYGPAFGDKNNDDGGEGEPERLATTLAVVKESFPANKVVVGGCSYVDFRLRDDFGKLASWSQTESLQISVSILPSGGYSAYLHDSEVGCQSNHSQSFDLNFEPGQSVVRKWVRFAGGWVGSQIAFSYTTWTSGGIVVPSTIFETLSLSDKQYDFIGARAGIAATGVTSDFCYPFVINTRSSDGSFKTIYSSDSFTAEIQQNAANAGGSIKLYNNATCTGAGATSMSVAFPVTVTTANMAKFYMKFFGAPEVEQTLLITHLTGAEVPQSLEVQLTPRLGSKTPASARFFALETFQQDKCIGPFALSLVNEYGTVVRNNDSSVRDIDLDTDSDDEDDLKFYTDAACSSPVPDQEAMMPGHAFMVPLYFKATAQGPKSIRLKSSNSINGYWNFVVLPPP